MLLNCAVQTYAWGKRGSNSKVAEFAAGANAQLVIDENESYAEEHAETLHKERPDKYPDPNHKPEMAIALTPFEGLCGFRQKAEIVTFLKAIPELCNVVGRDLVEEFAVAYDSDSEKAALKKCFTALMSCDKVKVEHQLASLVSRMKIADDEDENTEKHLGNLLLRLHSQFPGDVGCFVIYFLNYMQLEPGEAMFLEANLPHAYLSGDCMECMACSDNVVRAGLTPKYMDVPTLCNMLNYECKPACSNQFSPRKHLNNNKVTVYDPPVPDFTVASIMVVEEQQYELESLDSGSILILVQGNAHLTRNTPYREVVILSKGSVIYIPANEKGVLSCSTSLLMFRAYCQL